MNESTNTQYMISYQTGFSLSGNRCGTLDELTQFARLRTNQWSSWTLFEIKETTTWGFCTDLGEPSPEALEKFGRESGLVAREKQKETD